MRKRILAGRVSFPHQIPRLNQGSFCASRVEAKIEQKVKKGLELFQPSPATVAQEIKCIKLGSSGAPLDGRPVHTECLKSPHLTWGELRELAKKTAKPPPTEAWNWSQPARDGWTSQEQGHGAFQ